MQWIQKYWKPLAVVSVALLAIAIALGIPHSKTNQFSSWQPATAVLDREFVAVAIAQNYHSGEGAVPLSENEVFVRSFSGRDRQHQLYAFDFRSERLCGEIGCLYAVYTPQRERVLSAIVDAKATLTPLFEEVNRFSPEGFPCLRINQAQSDRLMLSSLYCYQGARLMSVDRQSVRKEE